MQKFTTLRAIAAPLPMINVDTDMIIPKQFLKTIQRSGLGKNLFDELRYHEDGTIKSDFVLNKAPYDKAQILLAGDNFGCGSSREHAPWALLDFGIRCVIAPSYADIFYNNCFKNGILPVKLPQAQVNLLMERAQDFPEEPVVIDLQSQKITAGNHSFDFDVEEFRKHCLINGLDDIGLTLEKSEKISTFETQDSEKRNWLYA